MSVSFQQGGATTWIKSRERDGFLFLIFGSLVCLNSQSALSPGGNYVSNPFVLRGGLFAAMGGIEAGIVMMLMKEY